MDHATEPLAVHHLAVLVDDLDRAEAFYSGVLGFPVARRWSDDQGAPRSVWVTLGGGAFLAIERAPATDASRSRRTGGFHCVAFAIDPKARDAYRERLRKAGYPVERETDFTLYTRDPEGSLVGLSHYPVPSPDPS